MSTSRFRVPHTLVLLFGMIVVAWGLTWVLPQGAYRTSSEDGGSVPYRFFPLDAETMSEGKGVRLALDPNAGAIAAGRYRMEEHHDDHIRQLVIPNSYAELPDDQRKRLGPETVFMAIPRGFEKAKDIIFFIFIIGGAFAVFRATGAADATIGTMLRKFGDRPALLVFAAMFVFAIGSSMIGMAEEYIPFVPLLLALCVGLGFDRVTAIGILCVGYGVGYGTAMVNPFTVVIAQEIAGLEPTSGVWLRAAIFPIFLAVGFHHVWRYAQKVKADPTKSLVHGVEFAGETATAPDLKLSGSRLASLSLVGAALGLVVWGIQVHGWYLVEMGAIFLGLTVALGLIGRLGVDNTAKTFCAGAAELTTTALLVGFANTIKIVLDDGQVVDSIVYLVAQPLQELGSTFAAIGMFLMQSLCNLFIPSGSGQAYVTMPIMAPLARELDITAQTAVLAYQFGDGFTNIIVPTNPVLIGILGLAGIPYDRWFRFVGPFILKVLVLGSVVMAIAVAIEYT
ncbi:MAG: AbgT family transporter [Planctomycetota bacterium]